MRLQYPTTPLLLSASVSIGSGGSSPPPNSALLTAPFRRASLIDEIRWCVSIPTPNDAQSALGGSITCKLQLGRLGLTSDKTSGGFIPIGNFGTMLQDPTFVDNIFDAQYINSIMNFRWRLPHPLYVAPGNVVIPSYIRGLDPVAANAAVSIAYAGRLLHPQEPQPNVIDVPYVALISVPPTGTGTGGAGGTPGGGPATYQSSDVELSNPFDGVTELEVQRFIGRTYLTTNGGALRETPPSDVQSPQPQVKLFDSEGYNVVRDFSNFSAVFDSNRRAWTFKKRLKPRERFMVNFQQMIPSDVNVQFAYVTMIASRKEVIA
jgi:hypothetical protein